MFSIDPTKRYVGFHSNRLPLSGMSIHKFKTNPPGVADDHGGDVDYESSYFLDKGNFAFFSVSKFDTGKAQ